MFLNFMKVNLYLIKQISHSGSFHKDHRSIRKKKALIWKVNRLVLEKFKLIKLFHKSALLFTLIFPRTVRRQIFLMNSPLLARFMRPLRALRKYRYMRLRVKANLFSSWFGGCKYGSLSGPLQGHRCRTKKKPVFLQAFYKGDFTDR
jgi:hypothetical protein